MKKVDFQISKFNLALFFRAILLLSPITLLFYQENGLSIQELFLFQGFFYLTSILSEVPVGYLSDNFSRKNILLSSFFIYLSVMFLWIFKHGFFVILIGEILFAVSKVMMDNSMSGYLYDYLNSEKRSRYMVKYYGYLNFCLALGTTVAAILGTFIYSKFGSQYLLISQSCFIFAAILLVISLPDFRVSKNEGLKCIKKVENFIKSFKEICKNKSVIYYIFYSGFLTSCSILFALSFQPVMQKALFPVALFGLVAFTNHGIRALSGVFAGKFMKFFNIRNLVIPLFVLYVAAFVCIFVSLNSKNIIWVLSMLFVVCIIIGFQLLFTIFHVSRLHKFVSIENRGNLMAVNNLVSRSMAAVILISSKPLINKFGLQEFFLYAFIMFIIVCSFLVIKTYQIKEKI